MNKQELLDLYNLPLEELISKAEQVTKENFNNEVEVCSIISAKNRKMWRKLQILFSKHS